jgi:hypothetical protein
MVTADQRLSRVAPLAGCPAVNPEKPAGQVTLTINDASAIDEDLAGYFTAEEWLEAETESRETTN